MEARWVKSNRYDGLTGQLPMVIFFSFGRGNISDGLKQSVVVKLGHPFKRSKFKGFFGFQGALR